MEVEILQQLLLDPRADAIAKECAVRDHYSRSGRKVALPRRLPELPHNELQEQHRRF